MVLGFQNVTKSYSGNMVLKNVSFDIKAGEIHALVGENGAGKSTLMNILFGMPVIHSTGGFEGSVLLNDKPVTIKSPFQAMEYGIGMVHQEFMLIPGFTVMENVKINREICKDNTINKILARCFGRRMQLLDINKMNRDTRAALDTLEMDIEEYTMLAGMPVGHMQFVEIAREIDKTNVKLLVLDEPTAVLTESEAENFIKAMKNLTKKGISIVFISHRLDEIIKASDRVTVLRDGELVETKNTSGTTVVELAELMVGRKVTIDRPSGGRLSQANEVMLSIKGLEVAMPGERVKGVNLEVRRGEILGIGGLAGQGKLGIANGIMGIYQAR
jgi:simple sugar transport system ATP-binding protein